jgi:UbiD family decarboxylase
VPVDDLREWIERIDALGELSRIDGADPASEIGGLTDLFQWDMGNPALLFDRIEGFSVGFRVLSNVLTSISRVALSLDLPTSCTRTPARIGSRSTTSRPLAFTSHLANTAD